LTVQSVLPSRSVLLRAPDDDFITILINFDGYATIEVHPLGNASRDVAVITVLNLFVDSPLGGVQWTLVAVNMLFAFLDR
jgi:hypothetical protein